LKIGYVSSDFNNHAVPRFLLPLFTHHDAREFEIFAYYTGTKQDAVTAQLRDNVNHWIQCANAPDGQLAELIRADGIDVLVDLAGHTAGNRLLVFARKPAPVQVGYLGYPSTTGLSSIDWRLVAAETDPAGSEQWHTERLWRLQGSMWCYRPATAAPVMRAETPARGRGYITFGSMNNIAKISDAAVRTWSAVLKAVPGSRLVMTNVATAAADRMRQRFVCCGVEGNRLRLEGRLATGAYRELLAQVDIALDPYPYNGTTTTCEVLWEGIPVVSLKGEASVARSGYALLKLMGLEELVGRSEEEYIAIAANLAGNVAWLERIRRGLRTRMEASALRDEVGFTRGVEAAYRGMWRAWCSDQQALLP
jgi:predicted O-linked N-acetylglucosamine transferase (SPINDLY family)